MSVRHPPWTAAAVIPLLAMPSATPTTFTSTNFASCTAPSAIAAGDLDTDGDLDVATTHPASNQVCANRNLGGGTSWANAPLFTYGAGSSPVELVVGNFDSSSRLDVAVVLSGVNQVAIHRATGVWPGFLPTVFVGVGGAPIEAVAFDVDSDADTDLAVLCQNPPRVDILQNTAGVFANVLSVPLTISPHAIDAGSFNLGGTADLVVTGSAGTAFADVLINTTAGGIPSFAAEQLFGVDFRPFGVCTGDFNEDGYVDIATANAAFSTATVLLNDPSVMAGTTVGFIGTTYTLAPGAISGPCTEIECGDFDCDADNDLAITCNATNNVAFFWNNGGGSGTFAVPSFAGAPLGCCDLVLGDFDGDRQLDAATANPPSNDMTVLLNNLNIGCCQHIFIGGIGDGFAGATPPGPEDACPDPAFVAAIGAGPLRNFDGVATCDQRFMHTFRGLPSGIKTARLTARVRVDCGGSSNDSFNLGWDSVNNTVVWGASLASLTGNPWTTVGTFGGIGLDLASLPGGMSLLAKMSNEGRLDVYMQDDTAIDSLTLTIENCSKSDYDVIYNHSPLVWGTTVTFSVSGAPTPPGGFAVLIGPGVGNGPQIHPLAPPLCIVQPQLLGFAATTGAGSGSFSLTLPAIVFPPCITLSSQAVAWDSPLTVIELSNTMTQQFFD